MADELLRVSLVILDAIRARDSIPVDAVLAPDFVHRNERGERTARADFLAAIRNAPFEILRAEFETFAADVFGDLAVVSGIQAATVRLPDGQIVDARTAFTDVFVRTSAGWLLKAATSAELPDGTA